MEEYTPSEPRTTLLISLQSVVEIMKSQELLGQSTKLFLFTSSGYFIGDPLDVADGDDFDNEFPKQMSKLVSGNAQLIKEQGALLPGKSADYFPLKNVTFVTGSDRHTMKFVYLFVDDIVGFTIGDNPFLDQEV
jgi:hypothetical protein